MLAPLAHLQNEAALAPEDLERQAKVAQGLSTLAAEPVRRTPMVEQGALGTLMRMMGDHADAPSVQVPGCTALWYLASERDCRRDIAAAGAIQRVLAVMTAPRYAGNAALQTAGAIRAARFVGLRACRRGHVIAARRMLVPVGNVG